MSSSPEPHHASDSHGSGKERTRRRERPPALDFKTTHPSHAADEPRSDREPGTADASQVNTARVPTDPPHTASLTTTTTTTTAAGSAYRQQQRLLLHVPHVARGGTKGDDHPQVDVIEDNDDNDDDDDDDDGETELAVPRSASATSSLDPYYFGLGTPSESPVLASSPMPRHSSVHLKTPELGGPFRDPVTPRKDPAAIDRRGLVGVGELATPRWARGERKEEVEVDERLEEGGEEGEEELEEVFQGVDQEKEPDLPDSPWTIEAIDGEQDDLDEVRTALFYVG